GRVAPRHTVVTPRIVAVPGPGIDGAQLARWGQECGVEVDVRTDRPDAVLRNGAAGARVLYGRGAETGRHAVLFLARRLGRAPDTLAYGPDPSQVGDLWVPAPPAGEGRHPVAVLFHGGFWYHAWER